MQPTDVSNVLAFDTTNNPLSLAFEQNVPVLDLTFAPADTATLALQLYFYRVQLTRSDGTVYNAIDWSLLDLNLGGAAVPVTPPFPSTVTITQDYPLSNDMTYMTPGGSPIDYAQVRVYYKSDYDAGNLQSPVGITTTIRGGKWANPILVIPGYTYVSVFSKPGEFGPDIFTFFA